MKKDPKAQFLKFLQQNIASQNYRPKQFQDEIYQHIFWGRTKEVGTRAELRGTLVHAKAIATAYIYANLANFTFF